MQKEVSEREGFRSDEFYKIFNQHPRSLYAQTGLGAMVAIFVVIKLMSGIIPKHLIQKHIVSVEKIVTMNMTGPEKIEFLGLTIAGVCGLFLLGFYGAEGDFRDGPEEVRSCEDYLQLRHSHSRPVLTWLASLAASAETHDHNHGDWAIRHLHHGGLERLGNFPRDDKVGDLGQTRILK